MSEYIIDIDKYRKDYGFSRDCDDCEHKAYQCRGDFAYSRMDICDFLDELETGYYKPTPGKWISVDDELPETNGKNDHEYNVLCYVPPRDGCLQSGLYIGKIRYVKADDGSGNFWGLPTPESDWTLWGWSYFEKPVVTHWMPLPEPPKKV